LLKARGQIPQPHSLSPKKLKKHKNKIYFAARKNLFVTKVSHKNPTQKHFLNNKFARIGQPKTKIMFKIKLKPKRHASKTTKR